MPSSYTPSLRLVLPVEGELDGTWGDAVNNGITSLVDSAIAGSANIAMSDANYTLTVVDEAPDQARQMFINLTGTLSTTRNVICPAVSKLYIVHNATTQSIVFKTPSGSGITVLTATRVVLYCNGTDVVDAVNALPAGTQVGGSAIVTPAATQTLTNKTVEKLVLNDGYTEEVFAITDGATVNLDPNNGSIQTWTLGANRTPGQANWAAGQSITLMVDDGTASTITWTTLAPVWETNGGTAPTLSLTGFTVIVFWKVGTTIYGARVGDA
jgi:hypothetical protein